MMEALLCLPEETPQTGELDLEGIDDQEIEKVSFYVPLQNQGDGLYGSFSDWLSVLAAVHPE